MSRVLRTICMVVTLIGIAMMLVGLMLGNSWGIIGFQMAAIFGCLWALLHVDRLF